MWRLWPCSQKSAVYILRKVMFHMVNVKRVVLWLLFRSYYRIWHLWILIRRHSQTRYFYCKRGRSYYSLNAVWYYPWEIIVGMKPAKEHWSFKTVYGFYWDLVVRVLNPIIETGDFPVNQAAIKMLLTKVAEKETSREVVSQHLEEIMPGLLKVSPKKYYVIL